MQRCLRGERSCLGCGPSTCAPAAAYNTLGSWLQVLTVPFYAWSQAASLPQRAAYLDTLLGSQSSHLATAQSTGLEPLFRVPGVRASPAMLPRSPNGALTGASRAAVPQSPFTTGSVQQVNASTRLACGHAHPHR